MKKVTALFWLTCLLITGCTSKKISRDEAFQLIQQDQQYPKVVDYDLYCSDPQHARTAVDAGLEEAGLVTVLQTQKLADAGKPLIQFTSKAQPYLLITPQVDKELNVQKVKLAEEALMGITNLKIQPDGKSAIAEYTTGYKNLTPFATLNRERLNGKTTHKAYFALGDNGWRLENRR
jgi:hypothetical protein